MKFVLEGAKQLILLIYYFFDRLKKKFRGDPFFCWVSQFKKKLAVQKNFLERDKILFGWGGEWGGVKEKNSGEGGAG